MLEKHGQPANVRFNCDLTNKNIIKAIGTKDKIIRKVILQVKHVEKKLKRAIHRITKCLHF